MPDPAVLLRSAALDGRSPTSSSTPAPSPPSARTCPPGGRQVVVLAGGCCCPGCGTRMCTSTSGHSPGGASISGRPGPRPRWPRWSPPGCGWIARPGTVLVGHGSATRWVRRAAPRPARPGHRCRTGRLVAADCTAAGSTRPPPPAGMADHPRPGPRTGLDADHDRCAVPVRVLDRWCADAGRAAAARGVVGIVDYEAPWRSTPGAPDRRGRRRAAGGGIGVAGGARRLRRADRPRSAQRRRRAGLARVTDDGAAEVVTDGSLNTVRPAATTLPRADRPAGPRRVAGDRTSCCRFCAAPPGTGSARPYAIGDRANASCRHLRRPRDNGGCRGCRSAGSAHRARSAYATSTGPVRRARGGGQRAGARARRPRRRRPALGRAHRPAFPTALLDTGIEIVLGSDAPVAPLDPWVTIAAAVHRSATTARRGIPSRRSCRSRSPRRPGPRPGARGPPSRPGVTDLDPAAVPPRPCAPCRSPGRCSAAAGPTAPGSDPDPRQLVRSSAPLAAGASSPPFSWSASGLPRFSEGSRPRSVAR